MNTLETIRGSWITRDREAAEANRDILRNAVDQIPADLRKKFLSVIEWTERTEQRSHIIIDGSAKDAVRHIDEITFLEAQIKGLIQTIRVTKDVDSIGALRVVARETIERIQERKRQEELKRLQEEGATFLPNTPPSSTVVP